MGSSDRIHEQNSISRFMQSSSSSFVSLLQTLNNPKNPNINKTISQPISSVCVPLLFSEAPPTSSSDGINQDNSLPSTSSLKRRPSRSSPSGFPSTVRIAGLNSNSKGGGPAFVGQVFSMCDISGNGLMAVSTHIHPFIAKRTPEWIKKMFARFNKNETNDPMFRFFMDLGDSVSYVKQLNIPTGVVGACRLDLAYEHFKEKPHMFQFIPNQKQVKEANKLLKEFPQSTGQKNVDGVPVFTAQNLDIAIATSEGIKWYTPYFFDKNMLDNILEESVDQHFHTLIQNRRIQRRRDIIDDDMSSEAVEDIGDSLWEPSEVQDVMDEMGHPSIPLSVISKFAEMQLQHAVDKVLLGNRWLRKAIGIQPKFPYMVDSFERRAKASFLKAAEPTGVAAKSEADFDNHRHELQPGSTEPDSNGIAQGEHQQRTDSKDYQFPFGDWFSNPWLKQQQQPENYITSDTRTKGSRREDIKEVPPSPLLPKITMVGISTGQTGQMSRGNLKKTMDDLTRNLEQTDSDNTEQADEERDPLFVANVGDYSSMARTGPSRWVRAGNNRESSPPT